MSNLPIAPAVNGTTDSATLQGQLEMYYAMLMHQFPPMFPMPAINVAMASSATAASSPMPVGTRTAVASRQSPPAAKAAEPSRKRGGKSGAPATVWTEVGTAALVRLRGSMADVFARPVRVAAAWEELAAALNTDVSDEPPESPDACSTKWSSLVQAVNVRRRFFLFHTISCLITFVHPNSMLLYLPCDYWKTHLVLVSTYAADVSLWRSSALSAGL